VVTAAGGSEIGRMHLGPARFACLLAMVLLAPAGLRSQEPQLFYETDGSGQVVVFIEDWAQDTSIWFRVLPPLRPGFELLRYDLRGQGRSEAARDGDYSLEAHRRDLLRVLDGLGVQRAHLVGAGFGGTVAVAFALAHPERTLSVTAINPHVAWTRGARDSWAQFLEGYDRAGRPPIADYASVLVGRWFGTQFPDREPWVVPFVDLMLRRQASPPLIASLRAWLGTELASQAGSGVPLLLLWGESVGPPVEEPRLHRALAVSRAPVENAGRMPHIEAPRATARMLREFLTGGRVTAP
jgi:pimeloyl-ACP methyl ester carboxylesterase